MSTRGEELSFFSLSLSLFQLQPYVSEASFAKLASPGEAVCNREGCGGGRVGETNERGKENKQTNHAAADLAETSGAVFFFGPPMTPLPSPLATLSNSPLLERGHRLESSVYRRGLARLGEVPDVDAGHAFFRDVSIEKKNKIN